MGMPAHDIVWTAEMVRALPDDRMRHEVLDGTLYVSPSPSLSHQRIVGELFYRLRQYLTDNGIGEVMISPADLEFSSVRLLQPDLFAFRTSDGRQPRSWKDVLPLLLAIEVLSPSTARADRRTKRLIYQSEHVPEYWIVDIDARMIERWRPEDDRPEILAEFIVWQPEGTIAPLRLEVSNLFPETD
jgi:Uma2 family endonuclease